MDEFDLNKFLMMREKRVDFQSTLIEKYGFPLIVLRANYPGENKNSFVPNRIVEIFKNEILDIFSLDVVKVEKIDTMEGRTYIFVVNFKAEELKKIAVELEDKHILGRCIDIDIHDVDKKTLSRKDFNKSKRKCILCDKNAFLCRRENNHSNLEIIQEIENRLNQYFDFELEREKISDDLANLAIKSIILEVSCSPAFGLVSPKTSGAHSDMDFFTFIESSFSLTNYLKAVAKLSYSFQNPKLLLKKIRKLGIEAEKQMFLATNNINTHKGMIFLMGIVLSCVSKALYEKVDFSRISVFIKEMCADILNDFDNIKNKNFLTNGEKLYLKYGYTGVRGIVKNGVDIVFNGALNIFERSNKSYNDINKAMLMTLLFLISELDDTTILHRHSPEVLKKTKGLAKILYNQFLDSELDIPLLEKIEKDFSEKLISPGGSADLLAVTVFLYFSKSKFYK